MLRSCLVLLCFLFTTSIVNAYSVTFRLNLNGISGFETPEVNGTFNNWCGNCNAMTDTDNDGIWEATINMNAGTYEYKFSFDSWTGQENLSASTSCTVSTGHGRQEHCDQDVSFHAFNRWEPPHRAISGSARVRRRSVNLLSASAW